DYYCYSTDGSDNHGLF
nr:immunoglobulin light chain junction region [Macaca mulatta]MOX34060.1 immunoglobulin light chain junction region [Macaca mulatta]MOX36549.1 immunoglobulin light chain junction region [Macaca mulatta]MOX76610.1 immunoglobulin light chain junction region [Macaca mulatta]